MLSHFHRKSNSKCIHAHIYFDADAISTVRQVISKFSNIFSHEIFHKNEITISKLQLGPIGPHPKGQGQITFMSKNFGEVVPWLMLNKNGLTVLVHRISEDEIKDHTERALWIGDKLDLNLDKLNSLYGIHTR